MVRTGRSYYSQNELSLTFGLGEATRVARVEIVWPSGTVDVYQDVPGDTTLRAVEGGHPEQVPSAELPLATTPPPALELPHAALPETTTSRTYLAYTHAGIAAYRAERYAEATPAFEAARRCSPLSRYPTATSPICTGARASQTRQRTWCGPWPRSCPMRTSSIVWARPMKSPRS